MLSWYKKVVVNESSTTRYLNRRSRIRRTKGALPLYSIHSWMAVRNFVCVFQASGAQGSIKSLMKCLCLFTSNFAYLCNNKVVPCLETLLITELGRPSSGSPVGQSVPLEAAVQRPGGSTQGYLEPPFCYAFHTWRPSSEMFPTR